MTSRAKHGSRSNACARYPSILHTRSNEPNKTYPMPAATAAYRIIVHSSLPCGATDRSGSVSSGTRSDRSPYAGSDRTTYRCTALRTCRTSSRRRCALRSLSRLYPERSAAIFSASFEVIHRDTPCSSRSSIAVALIGTPLKSNRMQRSASAMTCSTSPSGTSSTSSS